MNNGFRPGKVNVQHAGGIKCPFDWTMCSEECQRLFPMVDLPDLPLVSLEDRNNLMMVGNHTQLKRARSIIRYMPQLIYKQNHTHTHTLELLVDMVLV